MEKIFNIISIVTGLIGGMAIKFIGKWDSMLEALIMMMILDYMTGIIKAIYQKKLSSSIGFKGLFKKIITLTVICMANIIQGFIGKDMAIREVVIMFYVANEGISILENSAEFIPFPNKFKEVLLQLRGEDK